MKTSRFKILRVMTGLSQIEIARKAGITQAFVSLIETNKAIPAGETKEKLARILKTQPEQLFPEN